MLPPFECCLLNSILHDDFNMGYYFCPHRVAHFILQSIFNPKEEIYLIKTDTSKKILIYTNKGILESNLPLKTLEEKLRPCGFLRTHKSYIVNMNKVREIIPWFNDTYILTVENCLEKEIPVSRHFIQSFKTFLNL